MSAGGFAPPERNAIVASGLASSAKRCGAAPPSWSPCMFSYAVSLVGLISQFVFADLERQHFRHYPMNLECSPEVAHAPRASVACTTTHCACPVAWASSVRRESHRLSDCVLDAGFAHKRVFLHMGRHDGHDIFF